MKVLNIEAVDMGNNQQEIADWVMRIYGDIDWPTKADFEDLEYILIDQACDFLGWHSVPSNGGLIFDWGDDND